MLWFDRLASQEHQKLTLQAFLSLMPIPFGFECSLLSSVSVLGFLFSLLLCFVLLCHVSSCWVAVHRAGTLSLAALFVFFFR
jgi:hypothetical protein